MNLVDATINSVNAVYAQLGLDVGPDNFAQTAYQMGITSPLGVTPSQAPCKTTGPNCFIPPADAIGGLSEGITPLEQADGYATLASGGVHHDATALGKVIFPNGNVDTPDQGGNRVLTPGQAYDVTKILEQVITSGTGTPANIGCYNGMAGKTGTSEGLSDAWFAGYTPQYSTAVWVGHPNSRDFTGFGGPTAGPIWRQYMTAAQGGSCQQFTVPTSLPSLSSFTSSHTSALPTKSTAPTAPSTTTTPATHTHSTGGAGTGNYSPNLYQGGNNGIQGPPTPPPSGGGGGGGGSPNGGGTGPG
jgi:penicillin-binding protein 1A